MSVKFTPLNSQPMGGITMLLTSDAEIEPKAPPMTTPMARSTTFPRETNSLNSVVILIRGTYDFVGVSEHPHDWTSSLRSALRCSGVISAHRCAAEGVLLRARDIPVARSITIGSLTFPSRTRSLKS
jgi:hypothetical protein